MLPFQQQKRSVQVRESAQTSPKYGTAPDKRAIQEHIRLGFVNIDKPQGPTSHQVSSYAKKILGIKKCGHSGTLDPNVTGVLPIGLEKSVKVIQTLLKAGKEYVCLMHLHKPVKEYDLYKVLEKYTGRITQLPPVKSSVKRQWRKRTVYYIEVLDIMGQDVLFRVGCEAGTYIRKLVHDIGQELKVGAHMAELRRTRAGPFGEDTLCTLHDLADAYYYLRKYDKETYLRQVIQPVEYAVSHLPRVWVLDTAVDSLCHGASLALPGISKLESGIKKQDLVAVFTLKDELIMYGKALLDTEDMMKDKGLAVDTDKVIMSPGTYPRVQ